MTQRVGKYNVAVILFLVAALVLLQIVSEQFARVYTYVPWQASTAIVVLLLLLLGAEAFFMFRGGFWAKAISTMLVPIIAQVVLERVWGSDPAYPGLTLLLAIPYAALFFLGAVFVGVPVVYYRRSRLKGL